MSAQAAEAARLFTPQPDPFPHAVVDGHWHPAVLAAVANEFPAPDDDRWKRYTNQQEGKLEGPPGMWGPTTWGLFERISRLAEPLSEAFGIPDLSMETVGGGYHLIPPGGHLAVHTDFNVSPDTRLYRRLNLIVYLNREWDDPGGHLLLRGDPDNQGMSEIVDVPPEFNRTVVFETSDRYWHGHPTPTVARWRRSVAAYFFSPEPPAGYTAEHSTVWYPEP